MLSRPFYKSVPFFRFLLPFIAGILLQHYLSLPISFLRWFLGVNISFAVCLFFIPATLSYRLRVLSGCSLQCIVLSLGAHLLYLHDVRNQQHSIDTFTTPCTVIAKIIEPIARRGGFDKTRLSIVATCNKNAFIHTEGTIFAYFRIDSTRKTLSYGDTIVFKKQLLPIRNSGNPGCFDYRFYCLSQGITHQVFLNAADYKLIPYTGSLPLLLRGRNYINSILTTYIPGKKEQGLSEALFTGYKEDLDKDLLQAYTDTGVVHIIAISGGHLAIIYSWLVLLTWPLAQFKYTRWLIPPCVLAGLWLFTLITGSQPSIVRASIMFSCLVLAKALRRRQAIYNALACSATLSLAYNPFWLWDAGFQLSYAAVISILLFFKPVSALVHFQNKFLSAIGNLMAVSLAAQILTTPLSLYHFHQFPLIFLLTNIVAVPLSGLIITVEILLCLLGSFPRIAIQLGQLLQLLISTMDQYVERLQHVSFALWSGINLSVIQTIILLIATGAFAYAIFKKEKTCLYVGLSSVLLVGFLRFLYFGQAAHQKQFIVYNQSHYALMNMIDGRKYNFIGDLAALKNPSVLSYTIRPAETALRIHNRQTVTPNGTLYYFGDRKILWLRHHLHHKTLVKPLPVEILVLSHNPGLTIHELTTWIKPAQIVADASVPFSKAGKWKLECNDLHIPFFNTRTQGAFIYKL